MTITVRDDLNTSDEDLLDKYITEVHCLLGS